ncbi:MAG: tetratricopeptide repeat protein [Acidobacteria bacterium]|nr:tetratricopeptide repeat protein [Acidobacteriota bacterium]
MGVLLYELSCGFLPFEGANPFELAQKVIHDDPNRPSKRFRQSANRTWRKRLETDLDWIVMKALSRDQNQRYQTAAELNLDLQRFRRGQAISAHPPEWSYLIKKFISRHRSAVFAGTTILAILVFAVLALLQMYRRSEQARLHSEQEAKRAQAISEFLNDMLAAPDPKELGEDAKVIDFLDRSSQEVESRFSADPKVLAQVSTTLGDTYLELGRFDKAEPHYQRALAIHPENSTEKIRLLNKLGRHAIHTLDYSKAETYLTRGLELANQNLPPGNGLVLALRYNLAILHEETGSVQQAFSELVALKPLMAQLGDDDLSLKFACLTSLARVRADRGELAQAEVDLREVLKLQEKHLGPHHPETLATLFDLGKVLRNQEKFPEAELIQKREWELSCEVMGENHPETLISLEGFVRTLIVQSKFEQAQPLAEKSYHAFLEVFGPDHDFTAFAIIDQAEIKAAFNQPAEAEALFRQGLALAKTMDYQEKTHFTRFCERYIAFLSQQGRTQEAEKMRVHKCE